MSHNKIKMLILGASGLLGSSLVRYFSARDPYQVSATVRSISTVMRDLTKGKAELIEGVDVDNLDGLMRIFNQHSPDVVVNCIGVVKQSVEANDPLIAIRVNSILPHLLARLSSARGSRLIHISTDCVFSGQKGCYLESDLPDASDLYGRTKLLGEVDYPQAVTLRTSLIGHELNGTRSLVSWFLAQKGEVKGYTRAIFSGLPTVELAEIIEKFVLPHPELHGVYHLSVDPISKYDLLSIVRDIYEKQIVIIPDASVVIDRSLDSARFRQATGFIPKPWTELIQAMRHFA